MNVKHINEHQAFCIIKPNSPTCQNVYLHYLILFKKYETLKEFCVLVLTFSFSFPYILRSYFLRILYSTKTVYSRNTVLVPTTESSYCFQLMFFFVTEFINFSVRPYFDSRHKFVICDPEPTTLCVPMFSNFVPLSFRTVII